MESIAAKFGKSALGRAALQSALNNIPENPDSIFVDTSHRSGINPRAPDELDYEAYGGTHQPQPQRVPMQPYHHPQQQARGQYLTESNAPRPAPSQPARPHISTPQGARERSMSPPIDPPRSRSASPHGHFNPEEGLKSRWGGYITPPSPSGSSRRSSPSPSHSGGRRRKYVPRPGVTRWGGYVSPHSDQSRHSRSTSPATGYDSRSGSPAPHSHPYAPPRGGSRSPEQSRGRPTRSRSPPQPPPGTIPWGSSASRTRAAGEQDKARSGSPNDVTHPRSKVTIGSVARRSAQGRHHITPSLLQSSPSPSPSPPPSRPISPGYVPSPYVTAPPTMTRTKRMAMEAAAAAAAAEREARKHRTKWKGPGTTAFPSVVSPEQAARTAAAAAAAATRGASPLHARPTSPTPQNIDEARQVAELLNGAHAAQSPPSPPPPPRPAQLPVTPGSARQARPVTAHQSPPRTRSPSPSWTEAGFVSNFNGRERRSSDLSKQFFSKYRLRQHRDDTSPHRFSQPRSDGPMAGIQQKEYAFDEAHPALAEQHYLRTPDQNRMLEKERIVLAADGARRTVRSAQSRSPSPLVSPSDGQLRSSVRRAARSREQGSERLMRLEREGDQLRQQSIDVQQRALDAIAASERASTRLGGGPRSRTPSPAVGRAGSVYRSSSPHSASPHSASPHSAAYQGNAFGPPPAPASLLRARNAASVTATPPAVRGYYGDDEDDRRGTDRMPQVMASPDDDAGSITGVVLASSALPPPSGPALTEEELLVASGAFHPEKYNEFNRQVDMEMDRRALEAGGYDSDLEREDEAIRRHQGGDEGDEEDEARRAERDAMESGWKDQDRWMDFYRQRFGPEEGYETGRRSTQSSPGAGAEIYQQYLVNYRTPHPGHLSQLEEEGLGQHFVPNVYESLPLEAMAAFEAQGPGKKSKWGPTVPLAPFEFERREKERPKTIMQVKLEQDLEIKRQEEEAARSYRFKSSPIPHSVSEPKYERMMLEDEIRRQIRKERRAMELHSLQSNEKTFSFQSKEQDRLALRESAIQAAKDPNRFQIKFTAKPVPKAVHEQRLRAMQVELEGRRAETKARIAAAREKAAREAAAKEEARRKAADDAYQERLRADKLRSVDPILDQKYDTRPVGAVPDFDRLHQLNDMEMTRLRSNTRRALTVPHEFKLNGTTPDQQNARERKALERRQKIILDMQLDAEMLPEGRWPFLMPRGRIRASAPPPHLEPPDIRAGDTRSSMLRKAHTRQNKRHGRYEEKEEKDKRALREAEKEAKKRAATWMELQKGMLGGAPAAGDGLGVTDGGSHKTGGKREHLADRSDAPAQYIEARHAQAEKRAQQIVEDALMQQGLDSYTYSYKYNEN